MAKGQKRSNREKKKPKKPVAAPAKGPATFTPSRPQNGQG